MADKQKQFVDWFRLASPYIHAHRGQTFVLSFGGEAVASGGSFRNLIHDIALLSSLGIRLVIVPGAWTQVDARLKASGIEPRVQEGMRITDEQTLQFVKDAVGTVTIEVMTLLSQGLANYPTPSARIRVAAGNYITAKPVGVRNGVDFMYSGTVRRVDVDSIKSSLDSGDIVVVAPIGYSPTGECFNLNAHEVATAVASSLNAGKLIFLLEGKSVIDRGGRLVRQFTDTEAQELLDSVSGLARRMPELDDAINACRSGVRRVHLVDRRVDGGLLLELFSRDGIGTLVSAAPFDTLRKATIDDVGGVLELIAPLEADGTLVRRAREKLETEIDQFTVLVRDGAIIGCGALYPFPTEGMAELACLAVHPDYRNEGRGDLLLGNLQVAARQMGVKKLFVLTTQTAHWFVERGFGEASIEELPMQKKSLYNYQRNSKVFLQKL
jgi:amino-acid N-acetyltransferase